MDELKWLQAWYRDHCDGDWEHSYGVRIETLDNPGWLIDIDLRDTELETRGLVPRLLERDPADWVHVVVEGGKFKARCGALNLVEAIGLFRRWVERPDDLPGPTAPPSPHVVE